MTRTPTYHCQGSRLIIIVGDFKDARIRSAQNWATSLRAHKSAKNHLHLVSYATSADGVPDMNHPYVPDDAPPWKWKRIENPVGEKNYPIVYADCCYFQEVLVVLDGRREVTWSKFAERLPDVFNDKPVRKIALWPYWSSKAFFPNTSTKQKQIYEKLCGIVRPKDCPYNKCVGEKYKAFDADGNLEQYHGKLQPVSVLSAGEYDGKITGLGLDTRDVERPFISPDGRLRTISVGPDGVIKAKIGVPNDTVFENFRVKSGTVDKEKVSETFYPKLYLRDARTVETKDHKRTKGPQAGHGGEGCFPDSAKK